MSSDNWGICPRCFANARFDYEAAQRTVQESYGTIPMEDFEELQVALGEPPTEESMPYSLREYCEFSMSPSGGFYIYYGCSCEACDFKHDFTHTKQIEVDDDD